LGIVVVTVLLVVSPVFVTARATVPTLQSSLGEFARSLQPALTQHESRGEVASSGSANTVVATINVGYVPSAEAYDSGRGEVFVANTYSNSVSVISDTTNTVVATVKVGGYPIDAVYDSGKGEVFVVNGNSANVSVISDATNTVVATVNVGVNVGIVAGEAHYTAVYDSGKGEIFVANYASDNVSVISDATNTVVATVNVGTNPWAETYDSGKGEVFIANGKTNNVSVISDATNTVVATVNVGTNPWAETYDSGKGEVFIANGNTNNVSVISDATNTVVATVNVGGLPMDAVYDSGKGEVFVANYASDNVSVISDATNTVVATVNVGGYPMDAVYDSGKGEVFIANGNTNNVSVISDGTGVSTSFPVTFTETGLASGSSWSVTLSGQTVSSTTSTITFSEADGTYSYTVGLVSGYTASPSSGSLTVNGAGVSQAITFTASVATAHTVTFAESGLPPGTTWSVTLNGATLTSTASTINFSEPNGSYSFSVGSVSGYTASPASGSITVAGSSQSVAVTFTARSTGGSSSGFLGLSGNTGYFVAGGVAIAAVAVGVGAVFLSRRRGHRQR
jgi:YVTN family beta-propeller protein